MLLSFYKSDVFNGNAGTVNTELSKIRSKLVNVSIVTAFIVLYPFSLLSFHRFAVSGMEPVLLYQISSITLLFILMLSRKHLTFQIRATSLVILWLSMGLFGMTSWGLVRMGVPWLISFSIWAGMVLGWRSGIGIMVICLGIMGGVLGGVQLNIIEIGVYFHELSVTTSPWLNSVLCFGTIAASLIACSWYLNVSLLGLVFVSQSQNEELDTAKKALEENISEHKKTETILMNSEKEKQAILDGLPNTKIIYIDPELKVLWGNKTFTDAVDSNHIGHTCHRSIRGNNEPCKECVAVKAIEIGEFCDGEVKRFNGNVCYVQCNPVLDPDGQVKGVVVAETDITEWKMAEVLLKHTQDKLEDLVVERTTELEAANLALENALLNSNKLAGEAIVRNNLNAKEIEKLKHVEIALKRNEERYKSIIEQIEEGYFEMDLNGNFIYFNGAMCHIGGYTPKEMAVNVNNEPDSSGSLKDALFSFRDVILNKPNIPACCYEVVRKDGTRIQVESSISVTRDTSGSVTGYRGIVRDVGKRKKYEDNLVYLAYHDSLTGLYNRKAFFERMDDVINQAGRNGNKVALAFLDLDKFRTVNDSLGHRAGDELLKLIAERLVGELRKTDYIFRIGGDEFVVIFTQAENVQMNVIAKKLIGILSTPYHIDGATVDHVSASLGISVYPDDAVDPITMIKNADIAIHKAKQTGNRFVFYNQESTCETLLHQEVIPDLSETAELVH